MERLLFMIKDAGLQVLLTEKKLFDLATGLQWRAPGLKHLVCVDTCDMYAAPEKDVSSQVTVDLWNYIGDSATDAISAGGWVSSYTGEHMSAQEMDEFSQNAYEKLKPYLHKEMKVLEIGCASGMTMFRIAPEVAGYHGVDFSASILAGNEQVITEKGYTNIRLSCLSADAIDLLDDEGFDLMILNGVAQCFEGLNYLRNVLVKTIAKMKPEGLIFLGDIMDEDKRELLVADMMAFSRNNRNKGYRTKTDWSNELFISRDYLNDLVFEQIGITAVSFSDKIHTISNELTRYRFDALLQVKKEDARLPEKGQRQKYRYDLNAIQLCSTAAPAIDLRPGNLCYVMYTSGSSGQPKGVMIEHAGLINRLEWMWQHFSFSSDDVILQKTTCTFDVSAWEIFLPLCYGAKMVCCEKEDIASPERIAALIEKHKVTCLHFVPNMLHVFTSAGLEQQHMREQLGSLRMLVTSGEALAPQTVKEWYQLTDVPVYNLYGPTEASVDVTYYAVSPEDTVIPIGRPVWNTQVYITNAAGRLLPVGAVGEIAIAGIQLARGYLNNAGLSEQKFITCSFDGKHATRAYMTGDLGRWLPNGHIEFLGRKDTQTKIRGYRVELEEIEQAIRRFSDEILQVLVDVRQVNDDSALVGYIIADGIFDKQLLKSFLAKQLPGYMVPSFFIQLARFPFTNSGKINRALLPGPGIMNTVQADYVAPSAELERQLVEIWQEVLKINPIGIHDNFFDIGGHSLLATRVITRMKTLLNINMSFAAFFKYRTIATQCDYLQVMLSITDDSEDGDEYLEL